MIQVYIFILFYFILSFCSFSSAPFNNNRLKKIIDGFRPVSSGPEWRFAFELLPGTAIENSEVSTGVSKANSSTFSLEASYKVGLKMDVFSCQNSGKATTTTKVETIMSSSHVERVERTYEFPYDNSDNKQNEVHLYYQLVFIVKYADKKETKLNTNVLRRMVIQDDHKGKYPLPLQSAEDAWANLSR
jgi:hypothetical protein